MGCVLKWVNCFSYYGTLPLEFVVFSFQNLDCLILEFRPSIFVLFICHTVVSAIECHCFDMLAITICCMKIYNQV